jgi:hypothetical protein
MKLTLLARRHTRPAAEGAGKVDRVCVAELLAYIRMADRLVPQELFCAIETGLIELFVE